MEREKLISDIKLSFSQLRLIVFYFYGLVVLSPVFLMLTEQSEHVVGILEHSLVGCGLIGLGGNARIFSSNEKKIEEPRSHYGLFQVIELLFFITWQAIRLGIAVVMVLFFGIILVVFLRPDLNVVYAVPGILLVYALNRTGFFHQVSFVLKKLLNDE